MNDDNGSMKMDLLSTPYSLAVDSVVTPKMESRVPAQYRLARKPDGTLVLQGEYHWTRGWSEHGAEWRDIPTVDVP